MKLHISLCQVIVSLFLSSAIIARPLDSNGNEVYISGPPLAPHLGDHSVGLAPLPSDKLGSGSFHRKRNEHSDPQQLDIKRTVNEIVEEHHAAVNKLTEQSTKTAYLNGLNHGRLYREGAAFPELDASLKIQGRSTGHTLKLHDAIHQSTVFEAGKGEKDLLLGQEKSRVRLTEEIKAGWGRGFKEGLLEMPEIK